MGTPADSGFLDYLRREEILNAGQFKLLLAHREGKPLSPGKALLDLGLLDESAFLEHWARMTGGPVLGGDELRAEPEARKALSRDDCRRLRLLPLRIREKTLTVAMSDPTNEIALDEVRFQTGFEVSCRAARASDVELAIEREYPASLEDWENQVEDAPNPAIREIERIFQDAIERSASHIHLEPSEDAFTLSFRVQGTLFEIRKIPRAMQAALTARLKILGQLDIAERNRPQAGKITLTGQGVPAEFGIATYPTAFFRERVVLWRIENDPPLPRPGELGFGPDIGSFFSRLAQARRGLFLVAGAGRSGRTTTLYSLARSLASAGRPVL
ncbi:MAG TPA: ATPase, T2SS/T4P/T4SS family, partial [Planctomycetota bacterium]|nr:ATPase, T2SS/T4P/T4SS family [Planctomycetota bacterium]